MSKTKTTSILGLLSHQYQNLEPGKFIIDDPEEGLLELCPRAFSKVNAYGYDRQILYKALYELAAKKGIEKQIYPFGFSDVWLELVPEPYNKHDKNAVLIVLRIKEDNAFDMKKNEWDGLDLGYIPMEISAIIKSNINMVKTILIKEIYQQVHAKYYQAKISIGYGPNGIQNPNTISRFIGLMDE
jgi:hypothetical protein